MENGLKHIKSENKIHSFFDDEPRRVFSPTELATIIEDHRNTWNLAATTSVEKLIDRLVANNILRLIEIPFSNEKIVQRFFFGEPSAYDIALSLHNGSYLSHYQRIENGEALGDTILRQIGDSLFERHILLNRHRALMEPEILRLHSVEIDGSPKVRLFPLPG